MIRPTGRAVLIFVGGIPLSLLVAIYEPSLWFLSFNYAFLVLVAVGTDAALALPLRLLDVRISTPDRLYIGERGTMTVTMAAPRYRRRVHVELIADYRGPTEPAEIVVADLAGRQEARAVLPIVPLRRGRVDIDRLWIRWRGPLGLVEFIRQIPIARAVDVLPNVRAVHSATLQFFAQEAIYGIKAQQQKGEGAEFEALREYAPGLDSRFIDTLPVKMEWPDFVFVAVAATLTCFLASLYPAWQAARLAPVQTIRYE